MKILHIIKNLDLGGAEVNLLNLLGAFDHSKNEHHVAYSFGGLLEDKFKETKIHLCKYSSHNHNVKSLGSLSNITRLIKYVKKNDIKIIHTHNFSGHIWGLAVAKLTGCKIIEHVHDFRYLDPHDFKMRRGFNQQYKYVKYLKHLSNLVIVLTQQNADFLTRNQFCAQNQILLLPNGIPISNQPSLTPSELENIRKDFHINQDQKVILTPVRLAPEKNIDLIIRTAQKVIKTFPRCLFMIAGDGPLYKTIETEIKTKALSANVRLIGFHSNISELLNITDIFLLPSFLELHSIAILEAMSTKIPLLISSHVGCNDAFVKNWENGVLLDPFKDEGWAEAIIKLLDDDQLRVKIGSNGYETCVKEFNIQTTAQKLELVYATI